MDVKNELRYLLAVELLEKMRGEGLLTEEELGRAKRLAVKKYHPDTVWE